MTTPSDRPRRVLLVTEHALRGGAETSTVLLGTALRERGVDVSVAFGWRGEMLADARRAGLRLPPGTGSWTPGRGRLRVPGMLLAARSPVDVVHVSALEDRSTTAGLAALRAGRPTVAHLRSPWQLDRARALHAAGATVVTNSSDTARRLREAGCDRVHFVANGIDAAPFARAAARPQRERDATRRSIGVPTDAVVAICVANLAPYKAVEDLVPALALAMRAEPRLHVVHVGAAHFRSTRHVGAAVEAAVGASGVAERFHLLGSRPDVAELTATADLALVPSRGEGTARAVLEAWAAGIAVVAADVPGLVDLVEHGKNGALVDLHDTEGTARTVLRFVGDPDWRAALAAEGHRAVGAEFSHDAHVEAVLRAYRAAGRSAPGTSGAV